MSETLPLTRNMPYPLNNYITTDNYSNAGEVVFSPARPTFAMVVTGNMIAYQYAPSTGIRSRGQQYGPETIVTPGRYLFDPSDSTGLGGDGKHSAIRVRSNTPGLSANVFIQ